MDYNTITKRCKHAFDWWYTNNKPVWCRPIARPEDWTLTSNPRWTIDKVYVADNESAEFAKAIVDGKKTEVFLCGEWKDCLFNGDIDLVLEAGIDVDLKFRLAKKRWKPEKGEAYYYISAEHLFLTQQTVNQDRDCDRWRINIGNCFKTFGDCKLAIRAIRKVFNELHKPKK